MNNPYNNLRRYHECYVYQRGRFQGDAPLEKRRASHKRILAPWSDRIEVQMHNTVILTAYATGEMVLNTNGWHESPTTRETMGTALERAGLRGGLTSVRVGGFSQTALYINGRDRWRYYDGMRIDSEGRLLSPAHAWQAKVADRAARAAKREELKPLLDMIPILHAGVLASPENKGGLSLAAYSPDKPEFWPDIVRYYSFGPDGPNLWQRTPAQDWRDVRKRIVDAATRNLVKIVDREGT